MMSSTDLQQDTACGADQPAPGDAPGDAPRDAPGDAPGDAPEDAWRAGGLSALRAELDRIDNSIHDLLLQRASIVEWVARSGKPAAFRPGREAAILRRLVRRHSGSLPPVTLVRMWREMLAGTTSMQGGLSMAVCDPDPGAQLTQVAREHFGALTPVRAFGSAGQAFAELAKGVSVAVLPYPSEEQSWWTALLHQEPRLYIIGRLPFWKPRPEGAPSVQAIVVAAAAPDPSGEDRSFLGLECDSDVSRTKIAGDLTAAGLKPETMLLARPQGASINSILVEVDGFLDDEDPRLSALGSVLRLPKVLGSYAVPLSGGTV